MQLLHSFTTLSLKKKLGASQVLQYLCQVIKQNPLIYTLLLRTQKTLWNYFFNLNSCQKCKDRKILHLYLKTNNTFFFFYYYASEHYSINVKANIASNHLPHKIKETVLKNIFQFGASVLLKWHIFKLVLVQKISGVLKKYGIVIVST